MSWNRAFFSAAVVVAASVPFVGCSLPPVTTSEQTLTIKYNQFMPSGLPVGLPVPAFSDQQAPATTIPVPKEAKTFKLGSVVLNLKLQNTGPIPLRLKLFLSQEGVDPYTTAPLGGEGGLIELPANSGEVVKNFPIDPALLQADNLKLGYTFGSPGTDGPVTIDDTDAVLVRHSVTAAVKVF